MVAVSKFFRFSSVVVILILALATSACKKDVEPGTGGGGGGQTAPIPPSNQPQPKADTFALGQPDVNSNRQLELGLYNPASIFMDEERLIVADSSNSRVLIWNTIPTENHTAPDVVLGQPSLRMHGTNTSGITATSMNGPRGVHFDGTRLFVSDSSNSRVLIWNSLPSQNGQPADLVLGQADMNTGTRNTGGISAQTLSQPTGVFSTGEKLIVTDYTNHRILIWNEIPTTNQAAANVVIGREDFVSGGLADTSPTKGLRYPRTATFDGTYLYVAEEGRNRVLMYDGIPTVNQAEPVRVLGQQNFGGSSARSFTGWPDRYERYMASPNCAFSDGTSVYVCDTSNHRIMVWNSIPTQHGTPSNFLIGQRSFRMIGALDTSAFSNNAPRAVWANSTKIAVADTQNHRVLIFNSKPSSIGESADVVLGQASFRDKQENNAGLSARTVQNPTAVFSDGTRLFVTDNEYDRILIWNRIPDGPNVPADVVIGQVDMSSNVYEGVNARTFLNPNGIFSDGTRLFVCDTNRHRILVWNQIPTEDHTPADWVIGQSGDLTRGYANNANSLGRYSLKSPQGIYGTDTHLFVADTGNNRVLIWNGLPEDENDIPDVVVGQSRWNLNGSNWPYGSKGLRGPSNVYSDGTRLFVADPGNDRVHVWNTIPTWNGVLPDYQITGYVFDTVGTNGTNADNPGAMLVHEGKLLIADTLQNRILIWNEIPSNQDTPANQVLGQTDFNSKLPNPTGLTKDSFYRPGSMTIVDDKLFIADRYNNRIIVKRLSAVFENTSE